MTTMLRVFATERCPAREQQQGSLTIEQDHNCCSCVGEMAVLVFGIQLSLSGS